MTYIDLQYPIFFIVVALLCGVGLWFIVATKQWHGVHSLDSSEGPQKFHVLPTPRIGGVAIFIALLFSSIFISPLSFAVVLASAPAFIAGLAEDFTKKVSPRSRLIATFFSGLLAWWLTDYHIDYIHIPFIDSVFLFLPFSLLFTSFAVAGVAHAINLIDGFNGLAGGSVLLMIGAIAIIAYSVGDMELVMLSLLIISVLLSFMLFNFPLGKIFMGDGGAYLLGFLLAWIAVMLPMRNTEVSPWASLVVCAYPINEVLFSIVRRTVNKLSIGQPDSEHLHSLIKKNIIRPRFFALPDHIRNSMVAPFCWLYAIVPILFALKFFSSTIFLIATWCGSMVLYVLLYWFIAHLPQVQK